MFTLALTPEELHDICSALRGEAKRASEAASERLSNHHVGLNYAHDRRRLDALADKLDRSKAKCG